MTIAASDDTLAPVRNTVDRSGPPAAASGHPEPAGEIGSLAAPAVVPVEASPSPVTDNTAEQRSGTVIGRVPTEADDIAAAALAVPDVVRLHAGRFGEVATYLPGRRVTGVRVGDDLIEVHVVVAGQAPIRETARHLHTSVAALVATPVHVYIDDMDVPDPVA